MTDRTVQSATDARGPLRGIVLLLATGMVLGAVHNWLGLEARRPWGLPWIAEDRVESMPKVEAPVGADSSHYTTDVSDPLAIPGAAKSALPEIPAVGRPVQIELEAMKPWVDAGAALVIDARDREEYVTGHISGAISLPYDIAVSDPTLIEALDPGGRPLIVYCGGGTCEVSLSLAEELFYSGFERVAVYMGGYPEWEAAGYPVTTGEGP